MKGDVNRIRRYLADESNLAASEPLPSETSTSLGNSVDITCRDSSSHEDTETDDEITTELADILDQYLEQLENGTLVDTEQLIARYPQYETPLREYLDGLNLLNGGIAEMSDSPFRFDDDQQTLGDYELIREIGRGGMGVVYEARQVSLDRRVALKVLPFAAMLDQRQIVRFETEARAAARLQHPHIVPVHGVGCDRGVHYYAMQFIQGSSVRDLIDATADDNGGVTPREAARLGVQAASALHCAHSCGIVHRDIKPSNLLLDANVDIWIADFGLARSQTDTHVTRSGDVLGTLHYMSPEQARGESSIADPRSDIYSLGVTLFELLTKQRPFSGDTPTEVLQQIELGNAKSIRTLNPEVPRDLLNVVSKAMSVDPTHRYQTAAAFEDDLRRFMDGRATLAKPPTSLQRLTRWSSRNRAFVASSAAVILITCMAFACSTLWLATERAALSVLNKTAERKLDQAESTFERFGLATAERLKQIPGTDSARKALLGDLLVHYEELLDVSDNDASMREDRAITCTKIANIHRESGDLQAALIAYREAEADLKSLTNELQDQLDRDRSLELLAKCQSNMSVVLFELGDLDKATEQSHLAISQQRGLLSKQRTTMRLMDLVASHTQLASIEFSRDEAAQPGLLQLDHAKDLAEEARQRCSQEDLASVLRGLSTVYCRLGTRLQKKQIANAIDYGKKAVSCSQGLLATSEGRADAEFRRLHALNCNNLASLLVEQDKFADAVALYKAASFELEQIEEDHQLVLTLCNLAKAESRDDNGTDSLNTYGKAITVQSALLMNSPGNLNHVSRLGGLHNNRALALQNLNKHDHAVTAYESAIEYQERAYQLAPQNLTYYRDALSRTLFNAGQAAMNAGNPKLAARLQRRRSKLWPTDAIQLFSAARNIAAAMEEMPHSDKSRDTWGQKAEDILIAAVKNDTAKALNDHKVSQLSRYLRNEGAQR